MSVNGVTSTTSAYEAYQTSAVKTTEEKTNSEVSTEKKSEEQAGAVYEPSNAAASTAKKTYTQNADLVAKLKADAQSRQNQLQSIVEQLMTKQGQTYNSANGIWSILAGGNLKVDASASIPDSILLGHVR